MPDSKIIRFFASIDDIRPVIQEAEKMEKFEYILTGLFNKPDVNVFSSAFEIGGLGIANGDQVLEPIYIIARTGLLVHPRVIPQKKGGIKFAIDAINCKGIAVFSFGGIFKNEAIINGQLSAFHTDHAGMDILNLFLKPIKKRFTIAKGYFVGPDAKRLYHTGYRLTTSIKSPKEYDLKL
jgi:hypothetical protein